MPAKVAVVVELADCRNKFPVVLSDTAQDHPVGAVVPEKVRTTEQAAVGNPVIVPALFVAPVPMVAPVQLVASTVGAEPPPICVLALMSRQFDAVPHPVAPPASKSSCPIPPRDKPVSPVD